MERVRKQDAGCLQQHDAAKAGCQWEAPVCGWRRRETLVLLVILVLDSGGVARRRRANHANHANHANRGALLCINFPLEQHRWVAGKPFVPRMRVVTEGTQHVNS
jgi:hypothetical protein